MADTLDETIAGKLNALPPLVARELEAEKDAAVHASTMRTRRDTRGRDVRRRVAKATDPGRAELEATKARTGRWAEYVGQPAPPPGPSVDESAGPRPRQVHTPADKLFASLRRSLPTAASAAEQLLANLLMDPTALPEVVAMGVAPEDFASCAHGHIFGQMVRAHAVIGGLDTPSFHLFLVDSLAAGEITEADLQAMGGWVYLSKLELRGSPTANLGYFVGKVLDASARRAALLVALELVNDIQTGRDVNEALDALSEASLALCGPDRLVRAEVKS